MKNEKSFAMKWDGIENTLREAVIYYKKNDMEKTIQFVKTHLNNYRQIECNLDGGYLIPLYDLNKLNTKAETSDEFENIILKMNLAIVYKLINILEHKNDYDIIIISKLYNDAITIAKNKLNSDFWVAVIKLSKAMTVHYEIIQSNSDLLQAKNIFNKLNYFEFDELIDEILIENKDAIKKSDVDYPNGRLPEIR